MKLKGYRRILDYQLTDVLEMKYSKDRKALKLMKQKLTNGPIKDPNLYSLPSFVLEDKLVVIQDGDAKKIKHLYLLNSHNQSCELFRIGHSI